MPAPGQSGSTRRPREIRVEMIATLAHLGKEVPGHEILYKDESVARHLLQTGKELTDLDQIKRLKMKAIVYKNAE